MIGLFTGMSLSSLFEIVFWLARFFTRIWIAATQNDNSSNKTSRNLKRNKLMAQPRKKPIVIKRTSAFPSND